VIIKHVHILLVFHWCRSNLLKKPPLGLDTVAEVALAILSRLRPKQVVPPPRSKRSTEVNVNQKPTYRERTLSARIQTRKRGVCTDQGR